MSMSVCLSFVNMLICIFFFFKILKILCCYCCSVSKLWLSATPRTAARQAPLAMGFSRQEYWSGEPFPPAEDPPKPRDQAGQFFTTSATWCSCEMEQSGSRTCHSSVYLWKSTDQLWHNQVPGAQALHLMSTVCPNGSVSLGKALQEA